MRVFSGVIKDKKKMSENVSIERYGVSCEKKTFLLGFTKGHKFI